MDAGFEGLVKMAHFVSGKEENAGVVLQDAQEDGHNSVAPHVFLVSGLKEHVCFIKQQNAIPFMCKIEILIKVLLDLLGSIADISTCNGKKRFAGVISNAFSSRGFSNLAKGIRVSITRAGKV